MNIGDSVALIMDPEFRDNHYRARQYGRVLSIQDGFAIRGVYGAGQYAYVDWSDLGLPEGAWTPVGPESYNVGCLRVVYSEDRWNGQP